MSKKVKFFLALLLSLVVLSILGFRQLRRQFSEDYIAGYKLCLNAQGKCEYVEHLVMEDIASNSLHDKAIREHAKSIEAYIVARDISTIDSMLHDNEAYRIGITDLLSNELEDPIVFRTRFLFRTGGLAKNGEQIHLNGIKELLEELGAPSFEGDVEVLKIWFFKRYGMPVDYVDNEGPTHNRCNRWCTAQFEKFSQKERGKIEQRIRAKVLENRKSLLDQSEAK